MILELCLRLKNAYTGNGKRASDCLVKTPVTCAGLPFGEIVFSFVDIEGSGTLLINMVAH